MSASTGSASDTARVPGVPGADLLAALLDGMDAALCALDVDGTVTHWNREAERILGWSAGEAVGRRGFDGWAARSADAEETLARLMRAMTAPGRQVHEFALLRKDGGRVLVRTQTAGVRGADGGPAGVYCAFSEVHVQVDLERSIALSEALFEDASWGVVLVDVDLRPAVVNAYAARALGTARTTPLGRPLGEIVTQGVEQLEAALQHVLAAGAPPEPADLWVTLRGPRGDRRRCWRSGFVRLASPLAEAPEPVPLGVGWLFQDVTEARLAAQEADRLRFRWSQLHRAGAAAAECEDPREAAAVLLDFALAGFADHVLVDRTLPDGRLARALATPAGAPGPVTPAVTGGIPLPYPPSHPALQSLSRQGPARATATPDTPDWSTARLWPPDMAHALCVPLRSRARTLGIATFLRSPSRPAFAREDAVYAETVAGRVAAELGRAGGPEA
ncbi:PAS domain-containing protein [Streptomyces showdoensis]|uniref:Diguanylate cyclase n=1 Tax=Streptomyces showdoensis TaxID=68268 RepID=A0A2P2GT84_STREW|nr:PAS domain-containing protein [Streptomyces showdoensis]KKZ74707.1 diguanylate cyclase [Streptomyces showdoensis]